MRGYELPFRPRDLLDHPLRQSKYSRFSQVPTVRRVLVVTSDRGRERGLSKIGLERKSSIFQFLMQPSYRSEFGACLCVVSTNCWSRGNAFDALRRSRPSHCRPPLKVLNTGVSHSASLSPRTHHARVRRTGHLLRPTCRWPYHRRRLSRSSGNNCRIISVF